MSDPRESRDDVAVRRDSAGTDRDDVAATRDRLADQRDRLGTDRDDELDRRDRSSDARDGAGDDRDLAGDDRDHVAGLRDAAAEERDRTAGAFEAQDLPGTSHLNLRAELARREAASDRTAASEDRHASARERTDAELDRSAALADRLAGSHQRTAAETDRDAGASERAAAQLDRASSHVDRHASAGDRDHASVDTLTGVIRRGAGFSALDREIALARRTAKPLAVGFIDVDNLKFVNDTEGHAAGDRMLVAVVDTLRANLRASDLVFRYGGDEFVCALADTDAANGTRRLLVVNQELSSGPTPASVSVGFADLRPHDSSAELVARADAALYQKRQQT